MVNSLVNLQFDTSRVAACKSNKTWVTSPKLSDVAKSHTDDIHSVETNGNYYVVHKFSIRLKQDVRIFKLSASKQWEG